jgi:hypothetical protein
MLTSVENAGFSAAARARGAPPELAPDEPRDAVAGEAEAWAEVLAAWGDEARHRAYLARFTDLEGLAVAGRRYRDVLLARPGDAVAARLRDEVIRRAMAQGLAALPRTAPAVARPRTALRVAAFAIAASLAAAALLLAAAQLGAAP